MKKIVCMMVAISFLFIGSLAFGEAFQHHENYIPRLGEFVSEENGVLQVYENYIPQLGEAYVPENDVLQKYENYIPQIGDYLDDNGQVFEGFIPQLGEYYGG